MVADWPVDNAAVGVVRPGREHATHGDVARTFPWASITKLLTALAVLVAAEEGVFDLDDAAGPPGSTIRHLLAHASGLPFEGERLMARPGERRVYSNTGYVELGDALAERAGMPFSEYLAEAVLEPVGMDATTLAEDEPHGTAAAGAWGPLVDLLALAGELVVPSVVADETLAEATTVTFGGLNGVLPGFGRHEPNDWGLGFELRSSKSPHWTGTRNSARTFGHFGGSGTFLWVDPAAGLAACGAADRDFGGWARAAWPAFSDAVLIEAAAA